MKSPIKPSSASQAKQPAWPKVSLFVVTLFTVVGMSSCGLPFMQTSTPFPTLFVPTPDCGSPTLVLDSSAFQIQTLQRAVDGSLAVPADTAGIAYWVEGTETNYVFVLSPVPENLSIMSTITTESSAKITWKNCNSSTYSVAAPQPGSLTDLTLADQSVGGIMVFFQTDSSGAGFVVKGELTGEQISTFNTPVSNSSQIQAEIGLLETTASPDGATILVSVSINNWGQSAFTLSVSDVSLTQPDAAPLTMVISEPALPKEIAPGTTETIHFTFSRPSSPTATLKIFDIEYDLAGY